MEHVPGSTTEEVVARLGSEEATRVFEENKVVAAYLFGSHVKGRTHANSDVDVAVLFDQAIPKSDRFDRHVNVVMGLTSVLDTDKVDVVVLNDAGHILVFQVLKGKTLVFCADQRARAEFEIVAINQYYDFVPFLEMHRRILFAHIKERALK
jgi:uncharacterized protein